MAWQGACTAPPLQSSSCQACGMGHWGATGMLGLLRWLLTCPPALQIDLAHAAAMAACSPGWRRTCRPARCWRYAAAEQPQAAAAAPLPRVLRGPPLPVCRPRGRVVLRQALLGRVLGPEQAALFKAPRRGRLWPCWELPLQLPSLAALPRWPAPALAPSRPGPPAAERPKEMPESLRMPHHVRTKTSRPCEVTLRF